MKIDCSITKNYFAEKVRMTKREEGKREGMCGIDCNECPLSSARNGLNKYCGSLELFYPGTAVDIVQKWSDENQTKTRAEKFFENFPNAKNYGAVTDKIPGIGVCSLNDNIKCDGANNCDECWLRPYEEGDF